MRKFRMVNSPDRKMIEVVVRGADRIRRIARTLLAPHLLHDGREDLSAIPC